MAREEHVVEEFMLFMIEKPVEVGIYTHPLDPELGSLDGDFVYSVSGVLSSYRLDHSKDEWSFRFRNDPMMYVVSRSAYNILISYYTF